MIVYITRHGQPAIGDLAPGINHEFPPGDPVLTELGLQQAKYLGRYLQSQHFSGRIYSSPYLRTLYTAAEVAKATGTEIYPEKAIQEYVSKAGKPDIKVKTLPKISELIPCTAPEATLTDDWLFSGPEAVDDVLRRVKPFIDKLLSSNVPELLLVGHGASVNACKQLMFAAGAIPYIDEYNWNCSLSKFVVEANKTVSIELNCDISFMPKSIVTSNLMPYSESTR